MPRVSLKLRFEGGKALGPGKVRLLELIDETGSIWAAGRSMSMSYGRSWNLVSELNEMFREPLVLTRRGGGGTKRGGATLTARGREVIDHYRSIEAEIFARSGDRLAALDARVTTRALDQATAPEAEPDVKP